MRKWNVELFSTVKGRYVWVAGPITYAEFEAKFGTGNYADFRLTSAE